MKERNTQYNKGYKLTVIKQYNSTSTSQFLNQLDTLRVILLLNSFIHHPKSLILPPPTRFVDVEFAAAGAC